MDQIAQEPGFWDDIERSQSILKKSKRLRDRLNILNNLKNDCEEVLTLVELGLEESESSIVEEVANEFSDIKRGLKIKIADTSKGEYDRNDAIIQYMLSWRHGGNGLGTDAITHVYPVG